MDTKTLKDVHKLVEDSESTLTQLQEHKIKLEREYNLVYSYMGTPYQATKANKERWERNNRPYAKTAWVDEGNEFNFDDEKILVQQIKEYEYFCECYFSNMTKEDWLNFYDKRIRDIKLDIEQAEITHRKSKSIKAKLEDRVKAKDIPEYIERAIHQVALEVSKNSPTNEYKKISEALTLYHSTDLNQKEVAKKFEIPPNTFYTWKNKVEKLK